MNKEEINKNEKKRERETLRCPGTKILDPESQRSHLMFLLRDEDSHDKLIENYS